MFTKETNTLKKKRIPLEEAEKWARCCCWTADRLIGTQCKQTLEPCVPFTLLQNYNLKKDFSLINPHPILTSYPTVNPLVLELW